MPATPPSPSRRGGPADPFQDTQSGFAPEGQVGYFSQFSGSSWLWGFKLLYQYSDLTTANRDILPQAGQFTTTGAAPVGTTFTGNVLIGSSQTRINHQIDCMPFLGHAFANGYVYGGVGPALFGIQSNIYNAIGFADVNGVHMDVTGTPANFSSSNWVVGGAAQVGVTYFLANALGYGQGDVTAVTYEHGNAFLIVAGLLNVLVIVDACDVALGRK